MRTFLQLWTLSWGSLPEETEETIMTATATTIARTELDQPELDRPTRQPDHPDSGHSTRWSLPALGGITLISAFMNFYQLGQNGFGNLYYAAGVRSMLDSLHNFFFVSFDPGGFVTLDKPPLGFWLQAASARLFGFTPFAVLLPQALAGVLAVLLLYHLVRRHFGATAGLLAALALALSPVSVVTNRNNTIDSTLALVMLLGAWAVLRAVETGRLRYLLLSAALVGLGFNVKMLEAYLVVPAFGLVYLLAAPHRWPRRIGHLVLAGALLVAVSVPWMLAVDLTPADQRPYVDSTQDNSELSLAIGYNGIDRLVGMFRGSRGVLGITTGQSSNSQGSAQGPAGFPGGAPPSAQDNLLQQGMSPDGVPFSRGQRAPRQGAPGGGMFNTGVAGPLRLFQSELGGQIGWILPMAIFGIVAVAWQRRPYLKADRRLQSLALWGTWLLTMGVFFSVANFFHPYYLTVMAPAVAALFGIGLVTMWRDVSRGGWRGLLLPIALGATAYTQARLLANYPTYGQWLVPLLYVVCAASATLIVTRLMLGLVSWPSLALRLVRVGTFAVGLAVLSLLVAPAIWGGIPVIEGQAQMLPEAGPSGTGGFGGMRGIGGAVGSVAGLGGAHFGESSSADQALTSYLVANQGSAKYLVAVQSSNEADSLILATNKPVMALGGFSGSDPILTTDELTSLVRAGVVRFFLVRSGGFGQPPRALGPGGQNGITSWVTQNCTPVSAGASGYGGQLYDCQPAGS